MSGAPRAAWTTTRTIAYLLASLAGGAVLMNPPDPYEGMGQVVVFVGALAILLPGIGAAIGTVFRKYVLEWMCMIPAAAGTFVYSALQWIEVFTTEGTQSLPGALILLSFVFFFLSRFFQITEDDRRARLSVLARGERSR